MICAPLAMDWMSRSTSTLPFYVTGIIGLVVVICMFTISRMPGGLLAGRATREDLEKGEKPSDNAVEETKEVEMVEAGKETEVVVGDAEKGGVSEVDVENGNVPTVTAEKKGVSGEALGNGNTPAVTTEGETAVPTPTGANGTAAPWTVCLNIHFHR